MKELFNKYHQMWQNNPASLKGDYAYNHCRRMKTLYNI